VVEAGGRGRGWRKGQGWRQGLRLEADEAGGKCRDGRQGLMLEEGVETGGRG
jgi:hypothetical protein